MPLPDYATLNKNPESLLEYMKTTIILTSDLANSTLLNTPQYLELVPALALPKSTLFRKGTKDGKEISIYSLEHSTKTSSDAALFSYICDYKKNEHHYATIAKAAKFCFTVTMNGCTFGIGTQSTDGTVIVSHCNRASVEKQRHVQMTDVSKGHGKDNLQGVLNPAIYRVADRMSATTFGIRVKGKWKFYFQSWRSVDMTTIETFGVFEVPLTQVQI